MSTIGNGLGIICAQSIIKTEHRDQRVTGAKPKRTREGNRPRVKGFAIWSDVGLRACAHTVATTANQAMPSDNGHAWKKRLEMGGHEAFVRTIGWKEDAYDGPAVGHIHPRSSRLVRSADDAL